ncbi:MAG: tRNA lysidine(34) synthetase TilS [Spirochaetia bacterium]|nr:tRNA lysidine(34) synthetase TilS [Spirochaetia bacterium]
MKSIQSEMFLKDQVIDYFSHLQNFQNKNIKKILIGFSGGPDSVCLMDILYSLRERYNFQLYLGYFNHKLRPDDELEKEMEFIRNIGIRYDLPVFIGTDAGEIEKCAMSMGVEGAARKARYVFFDRTFRETGCDYIALAHNLDDTVENMVMRFFKGAGLGGLRGILSERDIFIRPLSKCQKSDILKYLDNNKLSFSVDKTNYGTDYLRNRVRNILLPEIKMIFPDCMKTLPELAEKISLSYDFIRNEAVGRLEWIWHEDIGGYVVSFNDFMNAPDILKMESIFSGFDKFARGKGTELPYRFVKTVLGRSDVENHGILLRGYGFIIRRNGDLLIWQDDIVNKVKKSYLFKVDKNKDNFFNIDDNEGFFVGRSLLSLCNKDDIWVPVDAVDGELVIRSRQDGDHIIVNGCRKKIKKFFSEWKISQCVRDRVPLICDSRGVIAIWGRFCGLRDRISDSVRLSGTADSDREVYIFRIRQDKRG